MKKLQYVIFEKSPGENIKTINKIESLLGIQFPPALSDIYKSGLGASFRFYSFWGPLTPALHALKSHEARGDTFLLNVYKEEFKDRFPRIIPIGEVGNGDQVCLDFRNQTKEPPIILWYSERAYSKPQPFRFLASSFDEMLDRTIINKWSFYKEKDRLLPDDYIKSILGFDALTPLRPPAGWDIDKM